MMSILYLEDDPLIARDVTAFLEKNGYRVDHFASGVDGWHAGDTLSYSAAVLDLGLPDMDGLTILKRWRADNRDMPVIVLTARGHWEERVEGIDAGADDYLAKPFRMPELLARLRAIIRRSAGLAAPVIETGALGIDTRSRTVTVDGVPVDLTALEYRCLSVLAAHRERPVSQAELAGQLYGDDEEHDSNAVEVLIARLRRKLGKDTILTRRGFGYQLAGDGA